MRALFGVLVAIVTVAVTAMVIKDDLPAPNGDLCATGELRLTAKVQRHIDGDTTWFEFSSPSPERGFTRLEKVRYLGIDTPELRSRDADEKRAANAAKDAVIERLDQRNACEWCSSDYPVGIVPVMRRDNTVKRGRYGRMLATICDGAGNINQWLVDTGHAEIYKDARK